MSTSLLERNATLFHNSSPAPTMGSIQMRKVCNINGPVSLVELGRSYCGLQKMAVVDQINSEMRSDTVYAEYVNNPPNLLRYPMEAYNTDSGDPFNEQFTVQHGRYGDNWCSANANMWLARKSPGSVESINWKFRVSRNDRTGTDTYGIVVATFPDNRNYNENVIYADTRPLSPTITGDIDIDIPADGNPYILFSLQHTVPAGGTSSTKYCAGISRYEVKYR